MSAANVYNTNPIIYQVDTDSSHGWRSQQTLNTGNLPSNAQQTSGAVTRQWGIQVTQLVITAQAQGTATVAGDIIVQDPQNNNVLFQVGVGAAMLAPVIIPFALSSGKWRDFYVTGVTTTKTQLEIWYRA